VPNADETIVGILSLRGAVVTIIDVRRRLGHPAGAAHDADTRVVVIDENGENLGFIVDRVERVVKVAPSAIEPQPVAHTSEHDESVRGVFRHADALTILLNLENLLTTNGTDL
jgi:purine-binding chemotaxis protein CheW